MVKLTAKDLVQELDDQELINTYFELKRLLDSDNNPSKFLQKLLDYADEDELYSIILEEIALRFTKKVSEK